MFNIQIFYYYKNCQVNNLLIYLDKIWLAERFFKGDFEKYNNNDGYINEADIPLNRLAQSFSYYTY